MREWMVAAIVLVGCLGLMPWAVRAMRSSGRRPGGGLGAGLLEMQAFIAPSTEHLIAAREDKVVEVIGDSDPQRPLEPAGEGRPKERAASDVPTL